MQLLGSFYGGKVFPKQKYFEAMELLINELYDNIGFGKFFLLY